MVACSAVRVCARAHTNTHTINTLIKNIPFKSWRAAETAQWIKVPVAMLDDLTSIPGAHVVERELSPTSYPVTLLMHHGMYPSIHIHTK